MTISYAVMVAGAFAAGFALGVLMGLLAWAVTR